MSYEVTISEDVKMTFDGTYYRIYKEGRMVAFSDLKEDAISYAKHYVDHMKEE